ncbi:MAG: molybdenum cofactor biosynthesis protein MoaE [Thermoprotei archaeon]|nr:MAG: molybdenum cofactor biosynthesis protein MoaE [Thermoprotei archaeon]
MTFKLYEKLPPLSEVESRLDLKENTGCFVVFTGVVRAFSENGERVLYLYYEANEELAAKVFSDIVEDLKKKYNIHDALLYHKIGKAEVGEKVMYVGVASRKRKEAFKAIQELVDRVKKEVPIWKKEVTESREYWVGVGG